MAKRSPILGYNHNVRYRGLIFHVQTEDSGVLSPHLFTHLFHTGVIVSTRKLVYDAGSDEGAIKSLMQAQHKAVMKDLKRGTFDDKIDQYLGGTPGLLPRGTKVDETQPSDGRDSQPALARSSDPGIPQPSGEIDPPSEPVIMLELSPEDSDADLPINAELPPAITAAPTVDMSMIGATPTVDMNATIRTPMIDPSSLQSSPVDMNQTLRGTSAPESAEPARFAWLDDPAAGSATTRREPMRPERPVPPQARTRTAERGSTASTIRTSLPPPPSADLDGPTAVDSAGAVAAAIALQNNATTRTEIPHDMLAQLGTPPSISEIIQLELDPEPSQSRSRTTRDTDMVLPGAVDPEPSDGVPGYTTAPPETPRPRANESVPPLPPPPRPNAVGASALPPGRPITRPPARPAITAPQVVSRPITRDRTDDDRARNHGDSDAIEVYAPAPPSAEPPPGIPERERPGQYSQHKRVSQRMPAVDGPPRERSGAVPIPPGLGRPGSRIPTGQNPTMARPAGQPPPIPRDARTPTPSSPVPIPRDARAPTPPSPVPVPQAIRGETSSGAGAAVPRARTPTPSRSSPTPTSRSGSGSQSIPNSGVVMSRPAVIVGAPAKPAQPSRVRKAREDEGRGFGQGLISEKSLDEVILAYLSEDADDK